jgi:Ino eighty subunit 1
MNHRKQQIDYMLDRRLRHVHARARDIRESESVIMRAWKRIRLLPADYDSEEEAIRVKRQRMRSNGEDDWRSMKTKDVVEIPDDPEYLRRPRVMMAGFAHTRDVDNTGLDVGEESVTMARMLRKASRRLERWQETNLPGQAMIRRKQMHLQGILRPHHRSALRRDNTLDRDGEMLGYGAAPSRSVTRQRSGTGRMSEIRAASRPAEDEQKVDFGPDDDDGGGELDEEERELLGEVDATDEDEDEDEEMGDD